MYNLNPHSVVTDEEMKQSPLERFRGNLSERISFPTEKMLFHCLGNILFKCIFLCFLIFFNPFCKCRDVTQICSTRNKPVLIADSHAAQTRVRYCACGTVPLRVSLSRDHLKRISLKSFPPIDTSHCEHPCKHRRLCPAAKRDIKNCVSIKTLKKVTVIALEKMAGMETEGIIFSLRNPSEAFGPANTGCSFSEDNANLIEPNNNGLSEAETSLLLKLKKELGQAHLFCNKEMEDPHAMKLLLSQIQRLSGTYPGGIDAYIRNSRILLQGSVRGESPYNGCKVEIPASYPLQLEDEQYLHAETIGMKELEFCTFVLVAGGMGERLGFPDIKIKIPVETCTMASYMELYVAYILAYESYIKNTTGRTVRLPLAIMTSENTHAATVKLLNDNHNFGMLDSQISLMQQENVPALIDAEGKMTTEKGSSTKLLTKPHGHGDVHTLLYQQGLVEKWKSEGRKWILFFQDTNSLVFRSFPAFLGTSVQQKLVMNSIAIPRYPEDEVGAICKIVFPNASSLTINVEYNVLDSLMSGIEGIKSYVDKNGYSKFPGNANILLFDLVRYGDVLQESGGSVPEFVNPKYTDSTRTSFKTPTRLECMMQEFPKLLHPQDNVGCTEIEKSISFSPLKNNCEDAAKKSSKGINAESAFTAESDEYAAAAQLLKFVSSKNCQSVVIGQATRKTFSNVTYKLGPRIVLKPSWAVSVQHMLKHILPGKIDISSNSTLIIEGDVDIDGLELDGTLILKAEPGAKLIVKNLCVRNKGWEFVETNSTEEQPAYQSIRGYKLNKIETCRESVTSGTRIIGK